MIKAILILMMLATSFYTEIVSADEVCEKVVFDCQLKEKEAKLCYASTSKTFKYIFFNKGKTELVYPKDRYGNFKFSSTPYSGGESHIRFSSGKYTYIIYEKNIKEDDGGLNSYSGIIVKVDMKKLADLQCSNDASIHQEAYEKMSKENYEDIGVQ